MIQIAFLDLIFLLSSLGAIIFLIRGWKSSLSLDINLLFAGLLIVNLFYSLCLLLEWSGMTNALDPYEDFAGALLPMMWAFVFYAIIQHISGQDLKKSEESLRLERDHLETITKDIGAGLATISRGYNVLWANRVLKDVFGEVEGKTCFKIFNQRNEICPGCGVREVFENKERQVIHQQRGKDAAGKTVWSEIIATPIMDTEGNPTAALELVVPITERKLAEEEKAKLESQLRQTQKMEAIGTLAGGIAHDFNNILSAIFGYADLALMDREDPARLENDINQVRQGAARAKDLINQILTLSRRTEQEKQPLSIAMIIKEAYKLLSSTIPSTIEIRQDIDSQKKVLADATQIHQVIMNLCTNAYQAMARTGGILVLSLKDTEVSWEDIVPGMEISPGRYVSLIIEDTGHGMDEKTKERIFEPYFSTKEIGEGTGLGLAIVHGIVKNHNGYINVYSEPGKGTIFHIYLPVYESAAAGEMRPIDEEVVTGGNEKILYVDDEEAIVNVAKEILNKYGYSVDSYLKVDHALEGIEKRIHQYDLVITDMTMPRMNGIEFAENITELRPDIPIILCSGYSELINKEKADAMGVHYFPKPIIMSDLIRTVRKILDKGTK